MNAVDVNKDFTNTIIISENPEPEQSRNHFEVNYLDLGDLIEQENQELTISVQTEEIADIAYQTHLTVNLNSSIFQDKTSKEIANLVIVEIKVLNAVEVNIYHGSLYLCSDLCTEMSNELQKEIKAYSHLTTIELKIIYDTKVLISQNILLSISTTGKIKESDTTAISFITPLLEEIKNRNIRISEIYLDATYKTARRCYELYDIIADVEGTSFPIAYLVLDTTKVTDTNFVFTGKDFAKINAVSKATNEFDFIDPAFYLMENDYDPQILILTQKHFDMHPIIPVDAQRTTLTPVDIRYHTTPLFLVLKNCESNETISVVPIEIEPTINNMLHNSTNIHEDLEEEACSFRTTWTSNRKPYLMYLLYSEELGNSEKTGSSKSILANMANNTGTIGIENTRVCDKAN
ncbi:6153_t:CDS:2 [Scutellospora calospora]|uniref:6153_t:CDS:1 n=1 Tax=Scutellospora calospora TaxID=85575 RepID=A0ACA9KHK8_9GLOM|nr:6153_t:CDS:2 [Scutellospora calospora]